MNNGQLRFGRPVRWIAIGVSLPLLSLVALWVVNYAIERSGKCVELGRALTDQEFVEAVLSSDSFRSRVGEQEAKTIRDNLLENCCRIRRDKSEVYEFDRDTLGLYIVEVEIKYYSTSIHYNIPQSEPYREIYANVNRCGDWVEFGIAGFGTKG